MSEHSLDDASGHRDSGSDSDALRVALAMVRADWQGDDDTWHQLWVVADNPEEVARKLTLLCRQNLERLATVAGVSSGEMLHRMAAALIPHPDTGHVTLVDLTKLSQKEHLREA